jgi:hypothetical protein
LSPGRAGRHGVVLEDGGDGQTPDMPSYVTGELALRTNPQATGIAARERRS